MTSAKIILALAFLALVPYSSADNDCATCYYGVSKDENQFLMGLIDDTMEENKDCVDPDTDPDDLPSNESGSDCFYAVILNDDGEAEAGVRGVWNGDVDIEDIEAKNDDNDKIFAFNVCDNKDYCNSAVSNTAGLLVAVMSLLMVKLF